MKTLYCIRLWADNDGVLNVEEESHLTEECQLAKYNPSDKTLYETATDQLFKLGERLAYSDLLDNKDKGLFACLCLGYFEAVKKLNQPQ